MAGGSPYLPAMTDISRNPRPAWVVATLAGVIVPAVVLLWLAETPTLVAHAAAPILAAGLMAIGMIGAAAAGRLWAGLGAALLAGLGLVLLVRAAGFGPLPHPVSTALAVMVAALSFSARGFLFSRALGARGWLMALFVVGGEGATLLATATLPGLLPAWLLALLPAQWASMALNTALLGSGTRAAGAALVALAGTAAATLLVARLLPRKWPYLIMFSTWLALSALVLHRPVPPAGGGHGAAIGLGPATAGKGT